MGTAPKKPAAKAKRKTVAKKPVSPKHKPLDYMLAVLRDEAADLERRDEMAKLAAPYVHAKAKELAESAARPGRKQKADSEKLMEGSDVDPIIRTARATLQRKLARLAAKSAAAQPLGETESG